MSILNESLAQSLAQPLSNQKDKGKHPRAYQKMGCLILQATQVNRFILKQFRRCYAKQFHDMGQGTRQSFLIKIGG